MGARRRIFENRLITLRLTPEELVAALGIPPTVRIVAAILQPYNDRDTVQLTISSPRLPDVPIMGAIQSMALDEAQAFFSGRFGAHLPVDDASSEGT